MRKILLILVLALSIFLCYTTVVNGLEIGDTFEVANYKQVEVASKEIDTLISQLVNINDMEYKSKQSNLQTAIKSYQDAKEEYEEGKKDAEKEIKDGEKKIADAEADIADIEDPKWYVYSTSVFLSYTYHFGSSISEISA